MDLFTRNNPPASAFNGVPLGGILCGHLFVYLRFFFGWLAECRPAETKAFCFTELAVFSGPINLVCQHACRIVPGAFAVALNGEAQVFRFIEGISNESRSIRNYPFAWLKSSLAPNAVGVLTFPRTIGRKNGWWKLTNASMIFSA